MMRIKEEPDLEYLLTFPLGDKLIRVYNNVKTLENIGYDKQGNKYAHDFCDWLWENIDGQI